MSDLDDPNEGVTIIEPTEAAMKRYNEWYGYSVTKLAPHHIAELQAGKMLAWNDNEYATFIVLGKVQP